MVRRFLSLLVIGVAHWLLFYPGEILSMYAVMALVLLVPAMFLPRTPVLAVGVVLTIAAYLTTGNSPLISATLLITGFSAAQFGLPAWFESTDRKDLLTSRIVFAVSAMVGIALGVCQFLLLTDSIESPLTADITGGIAGAALAVAYTLGLSLLWRRTGARNVMDVAFTPLGKMALTNYVGASAIIWVINQVIGGQELPTLWQLPAISVGILVLQWVLSALWLRHFTYGPIEWLWRMATRWEKVAI